MPDEMQDPTQSRSASDVDRSPSTSASGKKPDKLTRFLALLIDSLLTIPLNFVPVLGPLLAAGYFLVRDGLELDFMNQRSIGKHVMGLNVQRADGQPMDIETSAKRNWMFAIGGVTAFLFEVPLIGWFLGFFIGIPLSLAALGIVLYEGYRVLTRDDQQRWGDEFAATRVVTE